ncbi:MAG: thiamine pyrophosphate-binding protein, partial [Chloroflexi bacterium]
MRHVFGHPGGEVVDLIEGFREAGLEFVLTRHETSAAFMADAMATASGIPGVCVGTLGPGATNLVTGVAQSFLDRSPVIALSGQLPSDRYEITTHQKLDLRALFAPITKWQARVSPVNARDVIDRALRVALSPRRGPVYLEVPSDVPRQDARDRMSEVERVFYRGHVIAPVPMPAIDADAAGAAAQRIRNSKKPLILAGMDANDEVIASRLVAFAEEWSIPVMDSPKSKGVIREDHPLFLGTIEGLGTSRLYNYIESCDVVFLVGLDPVELDRDWRAAGEVVHIGPLPNDDRYYRATVEVVGPINEALDAIRSLCGTGQAKSDPARVAAFREEFRAYVAPKRKGLTSQQVLATLRAALPEDAI